MTREFELKVFIVAEFQSFNNILVFFFFSVYFFSCFLMLSVGFKD